MFRGCFQADLPSPGGWAHTQALATPTPTPQPQQLDPENTGFIGADTFTGLVHRHELPLDPAKLDMLVALAQSNERGQVCYQELADLVSALRVGSGGGAWPGGHSPWPGAGWAGGPSSLPCPPGRAVDTRQSLGPGEELGGPLRRGGPGGECGGLCLGPAP